MRTHIKMEEIRLGVLPRVPKRVFFLSLMQSSLSVTYPASISTIFETKDVKRCSHAYPGKNFRISAQKVFRTPKQLKMGTFDGCLSAGYCVQHGCIEYYPNNNPQ